ncbi:hypothetical protein BB561_003373 [Smittium simulii]|uniref:non-specific serine/threonine protein kinase n=1 Tax=Smittium simulii TaxID=133385 RepID=A0A2T9YLR5_9FUNG|nr:hypothetical protein BB561_003373 [Smittium simulii]
MTSKLPNNNNLASEIGDHFVNIPGLSESMVAISESLWIDKVESEMVTRQFGWGKIGEPIMKAKFTFNEDNIAARAYIWFIASHLKNSCFPTTCRRGILMIQQLSRLISSETIMDFIVPLIVNMFSHSSAVVRATAISCLAEVLSIVTKIEAIDINIFSDYLFSHLIDLSQDSSEIVLISLARNLSSYAESAERFTQSSLASDNSSILKSEKQKNIIFYTNETFLDITRGLLTNSSDEVKRALLLTIDRLCLFFKRTSPPSKEYIAIEAIMAHVMTFLNNRSSWQLRMQFFEAILFIGVVTSRYVVEQYILPLILSAIDDTEEFFLYFIPENITYCTLSEIITAPVSKRLYYSRVFQYASELSSEKSTVSDFLHIHDTCETTSDESTISDSEWKMQELDTFIQSSVRNFLNLNLEQENLIKHGITLQTVFLSPAKDKPAVNKSSNSRLHSYLSNGLSHFEASEPFKLNNRQSPVFSDHFSENHASKRHLNSLGVIILQDNTSRGDDVAYSKGIGYNSIPNGGNFFASSSTRSESSIKINKRVLPTVAITSNTPDPVYFLSKSVTNPHLIEAADRDNIDAKHDKSQIDLIALSPEANGDYKQTTENDENSNVQEKPDFGISLINSDTEKYNSIESVNPQKTHIDSALTFSNINFATKPISIIEWIKLGKYDHKNTVFGLLSKKTAELSKSVLLAPKEVQEPKLKPIENKGDRDKIFIDGILAAILYEHSLPVNVIETNQIYSTMHSSEKFRDMFLTGSDDGIIRVWDAKSILENVLHRSIATFRQEGKITSAAFLSSSKIVSCSDNGSIRIIPSNSNAESGFTNMNRVGIANWSTLIDLEHDEYAIEAKVVVNYNIAIGLLIGTSQSRLVFLSHEELQEVWSVDIPLEYGLINGMEVYQNYYAIISTSEWKICLIDLRFQMLVKTFSIPQCSGIVDMSYSSSCRMALSLTQDGEKVLVGCNNGQIMVLDLKKQIWSDAFCALEWAHKLVRDESNSSTELPMEYKGKSLVTNTPITSPNIEKARTFSMDSISSKTQSTKVGVIAVNMMPQIRSSGNNKFISFSQDGIVRLWEMSLHSCIHLSLNGVNYAHDPQLVSTHIKDNIAYHCIEDQSNGLGQNTNYLYSQSKYSWYKSSADSTSHGNRNDARSRQQISTKGQVRQSTGNSGQSAFKINEMLLEQSAAKKATKDDQRDVKMIRESSGVNMKNSWSYGGKGKVYNSGNDTDLEMQEDNEELKIVSSTCLVPLGKESIAIVVGFKNGTVKVYV